MKIKNQTEDNLNRLSSFLKRVYEDPDENTEALRKVDEILGLKILGNILDQLPPEKHEEFMEIFTGEQGEGKLAKYLKDKNINVEGKLLETSQELVRDIVAGEKINTEVQSEGRPPVK